MLAQVPVADEAVALAVAAEGGVTFSAGAVRLAELVADEALFCAVALIRQEAEEELPVVVAEVLAAQPAAVVLVSKERHPTDLPFPTVVSPGLAAPAALARPRVTVCEEAEEIFSKVVV